MIEIGASMGRHMAAVLTSMDQPVGFAIGNALEIVESIDCLRGGGPADLRQLVEVLGGHMLFMTHSAPSLQDGQSRISELIDNGQGLDVFRRMIEAQGGDPRVVDEPQLLPTAPHQTVLRANSPGYISKIDALEVGLSCVELGAGRQQISDCIDHRVGVNLHCRIGDQVEIGAPLMTIHHDKLAASLLNRFHQAIQISAEPPSPPALIYEMLTAAV